VKKNILIGLLIFLGLISFVKKDFLIKEGSKLLFGEVQFKEETLKIVLSTPVTDLSEHALDLNNQIRTGNIYEGLVAFDTNLRLVPALAVSWGNTSPTTWEFKLRKEVLFHDGSPFSADSVVDSFNSAKESKAGSFLDSIDEIKVLDPNLIQITTKNPDPLLPSKLTKFYMGRANYVGTGPYKVTNWDQGGTLTLTAFADYWGKFPTYRNVEYRVMENRAQRSAAYKNGEIDLLISVPPEQALDLPKDQLRTSYSLEVNFLLFKMDNPLLKDRKIRDAIRTLFDPGKIEEIGNGFVRQASQFIAPGVFGYNTKIKPFEFSADKVASNLFENRLEKIDMDYVTTYRTLSEYLVQQLKTAGFSVKANAISPAQLIERITGNEADIVLVGWRADDGDAGGFLDAFIHSAGQFNSGRYSNADMDALIEKSRQTMNPDERLQLLQTIMGKIDDELIGIPLFEASRLYAVRKGIQWEPRLDGLVLATEVK